MYVPGSGGFSKITRSVDVPDADPEVSYVCWGVPENVPKKCRNLAHLGDTLAGSFRVCCAGCVIEGGGHLTSPALLKKGVNGEKTALLLASMVGALMLASGDAFPRLFSIFLLVTLFVTFGRRAPGRVALPETGETEKESDK